MKRILTLLVFTLIFAGIFVIGYMFFQDMDGPVIVMDPDTGRISPANDITLHLSDEGSGVRSVTVSIQKRTKKDDKKEAKPFVVFEHVFPSHPNEATVSFNLKECRLKDGPLTMEIQATDAAMAGFWRGMKTVRKMDLVLDSVPPRVNVLSSPGASGRRGSSAAVSYTLSEDVLTTGVAVGQEFFPAYRQQSGAYFCLLAFPITMTPAEFIPQIVAKDLAGNETRSRLLLPARDRKFREDTLNISDAFLDSKMPDFVSYVPDAQNNLERYIRVNNDVRKADEQQLRVIARQTAPSLLCSGAFLQLPRSATRAGFGDQRTYKYQGQVIDHQTHMGQDFASVRHAPVPAANAGKVIFTGEQGIFGNLVVIDHGLGLMSIYSHMSQITIPNGTEVKRGDILGNTGVSGLAGGDHLHFGIMVNGIQVQPLDWLDAKWIRNNITGRLVNQ